MLGTVFFNVSCLCAWGINIEMKERKNLKDWEDTDGIYIYIYIYTSLWRNLKLKTSEIILEMPKI